MKKTSVALARHAGFFFKRIKKATSLSVFPDAAIPDAKAAWPAVSV
jgi:hypothetical protein